VIPTKILTHRLKLELELAKLSTNGMKGFLRLKLVKTMEEAKLYKRLFILYTMYGRFSFLYLLLRGDLILIGCTGCLEKKTERCVICFLLWKHLHFNLTLKMI